MQLSAFNGSLCLLNTHALHRPLTLHLGARNLLTKQRWDTPSRKMREKTRRHLEIRIWVKKIEIKRELDYRTKKTFLSLTERDILSRTKRWDMCHCEHSLCHYVPLRTLPMKLFKVDDEFNNANIGYTMDLKYILGTDGPTDRPTDRPTGWTDAQTNRPS